MGKYEKNERRNKQEARHQTRTTTKNKGHKEDLVGHKEDLVSQKTSSPVIPRTLSRAFLLGMADNSIVITPPRTPLTRVINTVVAVVTGGHGHKSLASAPSPPPKTDKQATEADGRGPPSTVNTCF